MFDLMICLFIHKHVQNCHCSTGGAAGSCGVSPVCHCYSRDFLLWAVELIADGVVLAKYLVTVLKG